MSPEWKWDRGIFTRDCALHLLGKFSKGVENSAVRHVYKG